MIIVLKVNFKKNTLSLYMCFFLLSFCLDVLDMFCIHSSIDDLTYFITSIRWFTMIIITGNNKNKNYMTNNG